jgi:hypothetical protein
MINLPADGSRTLTESGYSYHPSINRLPVLAPKYARKSMGANPRGFLMKKLSILRGCFRDISGFGVVGSHPRQSE